MKKTFSLTVEMDYDDMIHFDGTNDGFTSMELIGILETQKQKIVEDARNEARKEKANADN